MQPSKGGAENVPDFDNDDDDGSRTPSSEVDKDELEALLEILTEAFNEVRVLIAQKVVDVFPIERCRL